ncbi:hypothetical protein RI065_07910 [Mycoplasmatota bacterium zrk1]
MKKILSFIAVIAVILTMALAFNSNTFKSYEDGTAGARVCDA